MIISEALKVALAEETKAIKMYEKLLGDHPGLKDIFYFLLNEEQKHKKLIEEKIAGLNR